MTDAQTLLQRIAELEAQNALLEQHAKQQAAINLLLEQQSKQQQQQLIHAQKIETKLQTALKKVQQELSLPHLPFSKIEELGSETKRKFDQAVDNLMSKRGLFKKVYVPKKNVWGLSQTFNFYAKIFFLM